MTAPFMVTVLVVSNSAIASLYFFKPTVQLTTTVMGRGAGGGSSGLMSDAIRKRPSLPTSKEMQQRDGGKRGVAAPKGLPFTLPALTSTAITFRSVPPTWKYS